MRRIFYIIALLSCAHICGAQKKCSIHFDNVANGKNIVLNDSSYHNAFGEIYTVSKLKYYISNVRIVTGDAGPAVKNIFLIDAAKNNEIVIAQPSGLLKGIEFMLGVDSMLNCSGAQSGALDPLNDMFWTWNSGYVMFKLEGTAEISPADNHRIEQHIGGYKGIYKTMRKVFVPLNTGSNSPNNSITIRMNLDAYWSGVTKIKITQSPVISVSGAPASFAADNFPGLFTASIILPKGN